MIQKPNLGLLKPFLPPPIGRWWWNLLGTNTPKLDSKGFTMQVQMDGVNMNFIDSVIEKGGLSLSSRHPLILSLVGSQQQNGIKFLSYQNILLFNHARSHNPLHHSYSAWMRAINTLLVERVKMLFWIWEIVVSERIMKKTSKYRVNLIKEIQVIATQIGLLTGCLQLKERAVKRGPPQLMEGKSTSHRKISKFTKYS